MNEREIIKHIEEALVGFAATLWLAACAQLPRETHGELDDARLAALAFELVFERFAHSLRFVQAFGCRELASKRVDLGVFDVEGHAGGPKPDGGIS